MKRHYRIIESGALYKVQWKGPFGWRQRQINNHYNVERAHAYAQKRYGKPKVVVVDRGTVVS